MLHGFGGTGHAWDGVAARLRPERYLPLALDLPGHGTMGGERPITFAGCVAHVLARAPGRFALCGYSLGGRVALHVALAAPRRVTRLVLVSTSAGIEQDARRAARRVADEALARELENGSFERFIERWRSQPLFAGEPPEADALARADQARNSPSGLAAALRGLGSGEMQPLWGRLAELSMPVTIVAGERDEKYLAIGERMQRLIPRAELVVAEGGHGLPRENPQAIAEAIATVRPASRSTTAL